MENQIKTIHKKLHDKFGENIEKSLFEISPIMNESEVKSKAIFLIGEQLLKRTDINEIQKEIAPIFSEIFTDITIASYLTYCSIDNSARVVLRRILELGIAAIYLWDLPYKYCSWKNYDDYGSDLSFKDMLDYLDNRGYLDFVNLQNKTKEKYLLKVERINKYYRELSNVVHGKSQTFETMDENCFGYKEKDLKDITLITLKIENIILSISKKRFPEEFLKIEKKLTSLSQYKYEY